MSMQECTIGTSNEKDGEGRINKKAQPLTLVKADVENEIRGSCRVKWPVVEFRSKLLIIMLFSLRSRKAMKVCEMADGNGTKAKIQITDLCAILCREA